MPLIDRNARPGEGQTYQPEGGQIELVIAQSQPTDTIYLGFTAAYAAHVEYGANGRPPAAMVRSTAQRWQAIVRQVAIEAKARSIRPSS